MPSKPSVPFNRRELAAGDIPRLQRFFDENPEYHLSVNGEPPLPEEARIEFEMLPPPGWPYSKKTVLEFADGQGAMVAIADVLSDLFVAGVWHVGLFVVATRLHGTGAADTLYRELEDWMRSGGARWSRLGVVAGNTRAERFWARCGYAEVRARHGIPMGRRVNTVRVLFKALDGGTRADYLALVERDRPETP